MSRIHSTCRLVWRLRVLNPNCWKIFAKLVDLFNWLVGFVNVKWLSLTVWPGKQLEFRRFPCQTVKLSRITATKPTSRMDTRLDILQCGNVGIPEGNFLTHLRPTVSNKNLCEGHILRKKIIDCISRKKCLHGPH